MPRRETRRRGSAGRRLAVLARLAVVVAGTPLPAQTAPPVVYGAPIEGVIDLGEEAIDAAVRAVLDVHLLLDNYGTHKTALIRRWLARHPRFHVHFTPTGVPWFNLVERWSALRTDRQLKRGAHPRARALAAAIRQYTDPTNETPGRSSGPSPRTRSSSV